MSKINDFVSFTNITSKKLEKVVTVLDDSLPNIIETERNKIFEISSEFEKMNIDFWADDFILRPAILNYFYGLIKTIFNEVSYSNKKIHYFNKHKDKAFEYATKHYLEINDEIENFNYKTKFYELVYNYCLNMTPTFTTVGKFIYIYKQTKLVGLLIQAPNQEEYNIKTFLELMAIKEQDSKKLYKIANKDTLDTNELGELLDIMCRNEIDKLKISDSKMSLLEENNNKKLHFKKNML